MLTVLTAGVVNGVVVGVVAVEAGAVVLVVSTGVLTVDADSVVNVVAAVVLSVKRDRIALPHELYLTLVTFTSILQH